MCEVRGNLTAGKKVYSLSEGLRREMCTLAVHQQIQTLEVQKITLFSKLS